MENPNQNTEQELCITPEVAKMICEKLKHCDSVELKKSSGKITIVEINRKVIKTVTTG